jgi:soluble P-type ATPase
MIKISILGFKDIELRYLVSDYNGTLSVDGKLLPGVGPLLSELSEHLEIHVITADTFGLAVSQLSQFPIKLKITPLESQSEAKPALVKQLGVENVIAYGNGRNDRLMLKASAIGIVLLQTEGSSVETLAGADPVSKDILDALNLLENPKRLIASLRE